MSRPGAAPHLPLALLLAILVTLAVASVRLDSATSDEPAHIANGVIKITHGWVPFFREQPPLINILTGVPVVLGGYRVGPGWEGASHWGVGRRFLYSSGHDAYRILFLARLPTIALFATLVAAVYWFVFRQTGSVAWALAGSALTGFCPNLMAHGRLATVDLALALFSFASAALLLILIERPAAWTAVLFGAAAVAAILSKVSGLLLAPYFGLVMIAALVMGQVHDRRRFVQSLGIATLSALAVFALFGLLLTGSLIAPFAEYAATVQTINKWYSRGHHLPQFLMGEFSQSGWPHYYLTAFLLKTSIPGLLLLIAALVAGIRRRSFVFVSLLLYAVLFMVVASAGRLAIGLRYILPIYPFLYAATALALQSARPGRIGGAIIAALIVWHAAENLRTYPAYLAYFNQTIGGIANADKFLIDSNLDWGQDLRRLDRWIGEQGVNEITVHYFGGGLPEYEVRSAKPIVRRAPGPLPPGYFALSRHLYRVSFHPAIFGIDYDTVLEASGARLVTTIGGSINVYRIPPTRTASSARRDAGTQKTASHKPGESQGATAAAAR